MGMNATIGSFTSFFCLFIIFMIIPLLLQHVDCQRGRFCSLGTFPEVHTKTTTGLKPQVFFFSSSSTGNLILNTQLSLQNFRFFFPPSGRAAAGRPTQSKKVQLHHVSFHCQCCNSIFTYTKNCITRRPCSRFFLL